MEGNANKYIQRKADQKEKSLASQSGSYNNKDAMAASTREQKAIFCACDLAVGAGLTREPLF